MAQYEHLLIYKAAFDLLVYFEKIVSNFSRYNKYTHGKALREVARGIVILIVKANNTRNKLPLSEIIILHDDPDWLGIVIGNLLLVTAFAVELCVSDAAVVK